MTHYCMWCDSKAKYAVFDLPNEVFVSYTCGSHLTKTVDDISCSRNTGVVVRKV